MDTLAPPGAAAGFLHELGLYGSDDEFRALICPFALGGIEGGEPVVFAYDDRKAGLLREWLPDSPLVTYITDTGPYATPAKAIGAWRDVIRERLDAGASRVRIAGDVPHEGYGRSYAGWDRYEAAIDRALGDLPVWAPCLYDLRVAPGDVVETAKSLHRSFLGLDGEHHANDDFDGRRRLDDFRPPPADPLERTAASTALTDPTPAEVRAALRRLAAGRLDADETDSLLLATTEALTNAVSHGAPPVEVRLWAAIDRVLVRVHDRGAGPADPLVGLLPEPGDGAESGRGMWIAHNLVDVALSSAANGFSVRLRAGGEPPAG